MFDVIVSGGTLVDGTGAPARRADIGIRGDRIADIAPDLSSASGRVIDADGRLVCPGFIDIHTHSDLTVLAAPSAESKLRQGVTTEIVGNCGLAVAPRTSEAPHDAIRDAVAYLDLDRSLAVDFTDLGGYFARVDAVGPTVNVGSLVAHLPLRASIVGFANTATTAQHRSMMATLVDAAFDAGAVGVSTGLAYSPLCFADDAELLELGRVAAARGGLFAWHIRDYGDELLAAVTQALDVARRTGCRTQISHLVAIGRRNWGTVARALELVEAALADGLDVGVDVYPYLAGNCPLAQLLPDWAQVGGPDVYRSRLAEAPVRRAIRQEWTHHPLGWDEIVLNNLPGTADSLLVGRTVTQAATSRGVEPEDLMLDLLAEWGAGVSIVAHGRSEEDLRLVLEHPAGVVASDGQALDDSLDAGLPHPRSYGCFPRYLTRYAADLADGIRRCTSAPAARVGLRDRGRLAPGMAADIVILDPSSFGDTADFAHPRRYATGVETVFVNGVVTVEDSALTGVRGGRALRASPL